MSKTFGGMELGDEKYSKLAESMSVAELAVLQESTSTPEEYLHPKRQSNNDVNNQDDDEEPSKSKTVAGGPRKSPRKPKNKKAAGSGGGMDRTSSSPNVTEAQRTKIAREFGVSDKEVLVHEYIQGINPKVWGTLGHKPSVDDLHLTYGVRLSVAGDKKEKPQAPGGRASVSEVEPPRYVKLGKTMGLSEDELVSYDYIQTINPKVFDRSFGSRPAPSDITAPARFRPRTVKEVLTKRKTVSVAEAFRASPEVKRDSGAEPPQPPAITN